MFTVNYSSMSLDQAIAILEKHQLWRRDNSVPPKTQMQNPKEIGEALDIAIHLMKELRLKERSCCSCNIPWGKYDYRCMDCDDVNPNHPTT